MQKLRNLFAKKNQKLNSSSSSEGNSSSSVREQNEKQLVKVRILCPSARVLIFSVDNSKRIVELKNEVLFQLAEDEATFLQSAADVRQISPKYRLLRAEYSGHELNESMTLAQHKIEDNATLVLVMRRTHLQNMHAAIREQQAPRELEIEQATRENETNSQSLPLVDINEIFQQSNLQFDVRKVLISLAQTSAIVIGAGPYASRIINMLKQKLINKRNHHNDTVQCLTDMGFLKEQAEEALRVHQGVYAAALEYLIQNRNEKDKATEDVDPTVSLQKSQSTMSPSGIITNDSVVENTRALLEIVRIFSHREMPPNKEAIGELVEMGFQEQDVMLALKKTCNNKASACEWLCGLRSGSLIELRDGLTEDSPILKTILEIPQVQINLGNPKILLAFLAILENENSIRVWNGDNDTTSVITYILQKYHEEKHVLGINQFYANRT